MKFINLLNNHIKIKKTYNKKKKIDLILAKNNKSIASSLFNLTKNISAYFVSYGIASLILNDTHSNLFFIICNLNFFLIAIIGLHFFEINKIKKQFADFYYLKNNLLQYFLPTFELNNKFRKTFSKFVSKEEENIFNDIEKIQKDIIKTSKEKIKKKNISFFDIVKYIFSNMKEEEIENYNNNKILEIINDFNIDEQLLLTNILKDKKTTKISLESSLAKNKNYIENIINPKTKNNIMIIGEKNEIK